MVIDWLKKQPTPDYYFSVCTGAFILGKAGLLDHLTVTTFHESIDNLEKAVPTAKVLSNVRFVDNGKVTDHHSGHICRHRRGTATWWQRSAAKKLPATAATSHGIR